MGLSPFDVVAPTRPIALDLHQRSSRPLARALPWFVQFRHRSRSQPISFDQRVRLKPQAGAFEPSSSPLAYVNSQYLEVK